MNEALDSVSEVIAEKLIKKLSDDARRVLGCVSLPVLEDLTAEMTATRLQGLHRLQLQPDAPASVVLTDDQLLLNVPLQVRGLKVTGKFTALHHHVLMKGKFSAHLRNLHMNTEIAIGESHPQLKSLEVIKLEGLRLTSATGMTVFLNWLLLTVIDDFVDRNQMQLFQIIREASWKAYAEHFMTVLRHLDIQYMTK